MVCFVYKSTLTHFPLCDAPNNRSFLSADDDMPGHVKSSMMGVSLNVPIKNGRLALGTWQGIYLNEHRDTGGWGGGHTRRIMITLQGQGK